MTAEPERPQDPNLDGKWWIFETLEHGGAVPDFMPQCIRVTDAGGRQWVYAALSAEDYRATLMPQKERAQREERAALIEHNDILRSAYHVARRNAWLMDASGAPSEAVATTDYHRLAECIYEVLCRHHATVNRARGEAE